MRKGVCKRGHELTDNNSYFRNDGSRSCKQCSKERQNKQYSDPKKRREILDKQKQHYYENIKIIRERNRLNWNKYKEKYNQQQRDSYPEKLRLLKIEVLTHYGHGKQLKCSCCDINEIAFLTLDHINGRQPHERGSHANRVKYSGRALWGYLKRKGFPSGYQTLCWNCNSGRQVNKGICPHKQQ